MPSITRDTDGPYQAPDVLLAFRLFVPRGTQKPSTPSIDRDTERSYRVLDVLQAFLFFVPRGTGVFYAEQGLGHRQALSGP